METKLTISKEGWDRFFCELEPVKESLVKGRSSEELYFLYERIVEHNKIAEKEFLI